MIGIFLCPIHEWPVSVFFRFLRNLSDSQVEKKGTQNGSSHWWKSLKFVLLRIVDFVEKLCLLPLVQFALAVLSLWVELGQWYFQLLNCGTFCAGKCTQYAYVIDKSGRSIVQSRDWTYEEIIFYFVCSCFAPFGHKLFRRLRICLGLWMVPLMKTENKTKTKLSRDFVQVWWLSSKRECNWWYCKK